VENAALAAAEHCSMSSGATATGPREIVAMCKRWKVPARGVADDACFANTGHGSGSIAAEFMRYGVYFSPAKPIG